MIEMLSDLEEKLAFKTRYESEGISQLLRQFFSVLVSKYRGKERLSIDPLISTWWFQQLQEDDIRLVWVF